MRLRDLIRNKMKSLMNPGPSVSNPAETEKDSHPEEAALHLLLDRGHSFQDAELILETMKEWGLPLEDAATLEFEIHGKSVWIKQG